MKHFLSKLVPQIVKNTLYHWPLAVLANYRFGFPGRASTIPRRETIVSEENPASPDPVSPTGLTPPPGHSHHAPRAKKTLRIIGVTGTNGKTTTTKLIATLLESAGFKVAMASTIEYQIGEHRIANDSKFTTPSAWQLQQFLRNAVDAGCDFAVLETSSHSLDQKRVWGIDYEVAVITNVTREHLDYHKTMERYRTAKRLLFNQARKAVVNLDMDHPEEYLNGRFEAIATYSTKNSQADVLATNIQIDLDGSRFTALGTNFHLHLPGFFNVENALAAIAVGKLLGLEPALMARTLEAVPGIRGRMELVPNTRGLDILIDYAVTPDAFEKLYQVVLPLKIPGGRIIHVFGACGERDRGKRPTMGKIASEKADVIVLTNEDPYHEDPERILDDIASGINTEKMKPGKNYFRIFARRDAIAQALSLAERGDIVLVTGKGAEETMAILDERLPWREREVIEGLLEELPSKDPV